MKKYKIEVRNKHNNRLIEDTDAADFNFILTVLETSGHLDIDQKELERLYNSEKNDMVKLQQVHFDYLKPDFKLIVYINKNYLDKEALKYNEIDFKLLDDYIQWDYTYNTIDVSDINYIDSENLDQDIVTIWKAVK